MPARRDLSIPPRYPTPPVPGFEVPEGYRVVETDKRVTDVDPEPGHWLRWRAERRADELNRRRRIPSYRYEVVAAGWWRRYRPAPFQNVLTPILPLKEEDHD